MLRIFALVLIICAPVSMSFGQDETETKAAGQVDLRIGFSVSTLAEVNPLDVQAATKVFAEQIMRRKKRDMKVESVIFHTLSEIEKALTSRRLDAITLLSHEYLQIADRVDLDAAFVSVRNETVYERFLLLVHKDWADKPLRELEGKRILLSVTQKNDLPYFWLDTMLLKEKLPLCRAFFGSIEEGLKASQALLPVFFRQADACVVLNSAFRTMVELNPQIGEEIVVLRTSPNLLMSVFCFNEQSDVRHLEIIKEAVEELDQYPEGEQLLSIFRVEKQIPFKPEYLEGTKALVSEHNALKKAHKNGTSD